MWAATSPTAEVSRAAAAGVAEAVPECGRERLEGEGRVPSSQGSWLHPQWSESVLPEWSGRCWVHASPLPPVVYYMEGRDSMQLTYRWTKSLDPNLRKGLWTPEEDAVGAGHPGGPPPGSAPGLLEWAPGPWHHLIRTELRAGRL